MLKLNIKPLFLSLRPQQWIKNLLLFSAIFFNEKLFDPYLLGLSFLAFLVFCGISSASYLFNDIVDLPLDKKHPLKKNRPLAAGKITLKQSTGMIVVLLVFALGLAYILKFSLFLLSVFFVLLHVFYTLSFKKTAVLDLFSIATSFMLRILGSEIITGYHLSVWLFLTIFFAALFIAAAKRHAELVKRGANSRRALLQYEEKMLNFYVTTFATLAIISYILFAFLQPSLGYDSFLAQFFLSVSMPKMIERKWLLLSTPLFVFGISRYAQLVYLGKEGERPEKIISTDLWLVGSIAIWGVLMFVLLYL